MMNKEELHKRLTETYSRESWKQVVNAIFPNREFYATEEIVEATKQAQRDLTEKIIRFGNIDLDDGNSLALYDVELKSNSSNISRNRVGLRNLITSEIIPGFVDGALIVYHQNGHDDWRFSFYSKAKYWDAEGNEIKKETHPKRYTYVLGKGETCVTPRERFWYLAEKRTRTIKDVLEAFSVEKVSNEFFTKYKKHYQAFVDELMQPENLLARQVFGTEDKLVRDFVKKMLGRLVFLQFLQKKGWLDVDPEKDFGQGNKEFIPYLFNKFKSENFYTDCLVPLFFDTLNNSYTETYTVTGTKFPYLNGGLFERDEIEKNSKADLFSFRPELFENLFNFFGEYNFTIDESTPDDLDVGIDPEMLGHIFENLLEENHSKGAYYTPKLIVQYMCQEVLIQYLELHLGKNESIAKFIRYNDRGDENGKDNFIRKNASKINNLLDKVRICDPAIGSGAFPMGLLQEILRAKLALDWTLIEKKGDVKRTIIQNSIYGVDKDRGAVDIARLRFWLSLIVDEEVNPGEKPQPLPNFDYKIMQGDSLFESFKDIPLMYQSEPPKIDLQRDLFGNIQDPQLNIFHGIQEELVQLENDFFDPGNNYRKEEIRNKIDKLVATTIEKSIQNELAEKEKQLNAFKKRLTEYPNKKQLKDLTKHSNDVDHLRESQQEIKKYLKKDEKPYFLWHLYFKEVFDQGGFDIVIGNPPYIRQELITDIKLYLEKLGDKPNYEVYNSTSDLYTYFFELGHKILKPDKGVFSYICSKKYTRAMYGQNLRKYLLAKTQISGYIDFDEVQVFGATVDTSIIFFQKKTNISKDYTFLFCKVGNDIQKNQPLIDYVTNLGYYYPSSSLISANWSFVDKPKEFVKDIISKSGKLFKNWEFKALRGLLSGFNEAFYISEEKKAYLISTHPLLESFIKPLLRGRDIDRFIYRFEKQYLVLIPSGWTDINKGEKVADEFFEEQFPALHSHFLDVQDNFVRNNKKKNVKGLFDRTDQGKYWWELRDCAYLDEFEKEKIIWLVLTDKAKFCLDTSNHYTNNATFIITGNNLKYIMSILNAKVSEWYYDKITNSSGVGTNKWEKVYIEQIPIPEISKNEMSPFEILADYITFIKKFDGRISPYTPNEHMAANFEELLDACVYELYFKEHMQEQGITVLDEVKTLLIPIDELEEVAQTTEIIEIINTVYDEYKSTDNIIRRRILDFPVKSPDIINVIQNG
jgi:type I restriction-modification system DNA methylase subunit